MLGLGMATAAAVVIVIGDAGGEVERKRKKEKKKGAPASAGVLASIQCDWVSWSSGKAGAVDCHYRRCQGAGAKVVVAVVVPERH